MTDSSCRCALEAGGPVSTKVWLRQLMKKSPEEYRATFQQFKQALASTEAGSGTGASSGRGRPRKTATFSGRPSMQTVEPAHVLT